MPKASVKRLIDNRKDKLIEFVLDIEKYPEFIPFCEQPKVSKYRNKIIKSLSNLLNIDKELINLKGKTVEKLGLIGKEKAIACEVICSIAQ